MTISGSSSIQSMGRNQEALEKEGDDIGVVAVERIRA